MTTPQTVPELAGTGTPVLEARSLVKYFPVHRRGRRTGRGAVVHAVEGVSMAVPEASITAVVGESGCGKSTLTQMLARLIRPTAGELLLGGRPAARLGARQYAGQVQMVLQDPFSSLNQVHTVGYHLARPLRIHRPGLDGTGLQQEIASLLERVSLSPATAAKYPHELSGGQRQRVAIARALAVRPTVLLADEPVSMLDVSIRLGVLNLLADLRERERLRTRYRADCDGPHVIGAGGVGQLTFTVNGTEVAAGHTDPPADPVEAMVRPGEIRATVDLTAGTETEIAITLLPDDWPQGPVAIRLGLAPAPDDEAMLSQAVEAARAADAAVVVVGSAAATESEGFDRPGLALPGRQDELIRRVAAVNDRTIVIVNAGTPVLMPWAGQVAAAGYAWLPGQEMGAALADVLLGRAEPGGRLPVTIPAAEADCPVLHAVPDQEGRLEYREGLLIGYRGYDHAGTRPRFPFGHGLGYTTWEYQSAAADTTMVAPGEDLGVTVLIRNTGRRAGREVIQAYLEPPAAEPGRPVRVLAAFTTVTAAPGEHAGARLTIPARAFDRYDETAGTWARPSGEFTVRIGRSSADLPLHLRIKADDYR